MDYSFCSNSGLQLPKMSLGSWHNFGDESSRKSIMASIDQSLKRTGLEYFDIFYFHRYDPQTPIEKTMQTLIGIVKQGKTLDRKII